MDTTKVKEYASSSAPWRRGAAWYVVLIEGAALAAVGLFALIAEDSARETVFALFGVLLALNGLGASMAAFRKEPSKSSAFHGFRGGIGLSFGLLALVARFSNAFDSESARIILATGFLIVGVVSLAALFMAREERKFPIGNLAWNVSLILISILFFTGSDESNSRLTLIGWTGIILGALLIAFAFYLKQKAAGETLMSTSGTPSRSPKATESATVESTTTVETAEPTESSTQS